MATEQHETVDQRIVVVGGSSGVGLGVAQAALRSGFGVTIVGRSRDRLERAVRDLGAPDRLHAVAADVTDEGQVQAMFAQTGPVDHVVVTAADIVSYQPIRELELEAARTTIDSKLVAALLIAKHAPARLSTRGSLTFTGGVAAERPAPGGSVVAAVNSALTGLARALALELAPIRVNVIAPGWIETPFWDKMPNKDAMLANMAERLPGGRIGQPDDIGEAVVYMTQASYLTGTVLHLDGGQRLV